MFILSCCPRAPFTKKVERKITNTFSNLEGVNFETIHLEKIYFRKLYLVKMSF